MTTFAAAAAAVLVCLAGMLVFGEACKNVPVMTSADACMKLIPNTTERRHGLCRDMLLDAPATAEVTVYAMVVARQTRLRFRDAAAEMDQMLNTGGNPLPNGDATAIEHCRDNYSEAARLMGAIAAQLFACDLSRIRLRQEYIHAQLAVRSCQDVCRGYPCFDMVTVDIDLTMVAYLLGSIIIGR
ncbi:unnamed protein product [Urochloa humidicola]